MKSTLRVIRSLNIVFLCQVMFCPFYPLLDMQYKGENMVLGIYFSLVPPIYAIYQHTGLLEFKSHSFNSESSSPFPLMPRSSGIPPHRLSSVAPRTWRRRSAWKHPPRPMLDSSGGCSRPAAAWRRSFRRASPGSP
jgi:hypothetical protein